MNRRFFLRMGVCTGLSLGAGFWPGLGRLITDAQARGAGAEESAKARRIFAQAGALPKGNPVSPQNNVFTLKAGDVLTFTCEGYCLDGNLAVPSDGEPLAFRPMQGYIAPELRPLYIGLMRNAEAGKRQDIDLQQLVYAIRSEPVENSRILDSKDYAFANRVASGGERLLKRAARPEQYTFAFGLSFWASKSMPGESQTYSMLRADGVAGRAMGAGGLDMNVTIVNGSPKNFVFDPTQWVLEPSRDVQSVAVPVCSRAFLATNAVAVTAQPNSATAGEATGANSKAGSKAKEGSSKSRQGEKNQPGLAPGGGDDTFAGY